MGDFNIIRSDEERVGGRARPPLAIEDFNDCINNCGLMDLPLVDRQLSWCNGQQGLARSWAKLDRIVINSDFGLTHGQATARLLSRRMSDHSPILLNLASEGGRLVGKLKRLKQKLRQWNREVFGRVDRVIKELEERLEQYEEALLASYSEDIEEEFLITKAELEIWYKREDTRLAQQAKQTWQEEGDQNTKFFQR
ncbi:hypothetical protein F2P56_013315 [Juglans regia]|uniref:Uncharacterized protein LOC108980212 n=2 Tax=Juglans regia TaxID=51240 RepID=A0A2I4DHJ2_JUGRE|nr:uncharacterized protein LOC108980212 [Juglans regia]KAF5469226.1 hypothetical protein F2P56_013315 [Juglans regia]